MLHFIVNPTSRSGKGKKIWKELLPTVKNSSIQYDVHMTEGPGDAARLAAALSEKADQAAEVDAYVVTLRFQDREVLMESDVRKDPVPLKYADFKKLRRGRDVILIRTFARMAYTLDPAGFENGTEADFWKLMNEKCPNAVPKNLRQA